MELFVVKKSLAVSIVEVKEKILVGILMETDAKLQVGVPVHVPSLSFHKSGGKYVFSVYGI